MTDPTPTQIDDGGAAKNKHKCAAAVYSNSYLNPVRRCKRNAVNDGLCQQHWTKQARGGRVRKMKIAMDEKRRRTDRSTPDASK